MSRYQVLLYGCAPPPTEWERPLPNPVYPNAAPLEGVIDPNTSIEALRDVGTAAPKLHGTEAVGALRELYFRLMKIAPGCDNATVKAVGIEISRLIGEISLGEWKP